jgi:hypothetical protein
MDVEKLKETYVPVQPSPGGASFWSQFYGLFVKRAIAFKRDRSVAVISLILPITIAIGAAAIMQQIPLLTCDKPALLYSAPLSLDLTILYGAKIPSNPYSLVPLDTRAEVSANFPVDPNPENVRRAYSAVPASFAISDSNLPASIGANRGKIPGALQACCSSLSAASSGLHAFYNAALLHSLPATITTAYSSMLYHINGGTITCRSWPLPKQDDEFFSPETGRSVNGSLFGCIFLAVSLGMALGSIVVNPVSHPVLPSAATIIALLF